MSCCGCLACPVPVHVRLKIPTAPISSPALGQQACIGADMEIWLPHCPWDPGHWFCPARDRQTPTFCRYSPSQVLTLPPDPPKLSSVAQPTTAWATSNPKRGSLQLTVSLGALPGHRVAGHQTLRTASVSGCVECWTLPEASTDSQGDAQTLSLILFLGQ